MAKVAIAKRKAKRLAGASVQFSSELNQWLQIMYSVVNEAAVPFGMQMFTTEAEAMVAANEALKTTDTDWAEIHEDAIERHILEHTRNKWSVKG